jgi:hypothetical protein
VFEALWVGSLAGEDDHRAAALVGVSTSWSVVEHALFRRISAFGQIVGLSARAQG